MTHDALFRLPCSPMLQALLVAAMLAGCGGGIGDATDTAAATPAATLAANAAPTEAPRQAASALPASYTMRFIPLPVGAQQIFPSPRGPRIINAKGQFVGLAETGFLYDPQTDAVIPIGQSSGTTFYFPTGVNDSGSVAGIVTTGGDAPGFSWTASTGATVFALPNTSVHSAFIASDGLVGGRDNRTEDCGGYTWQPSSGTLLQHPGFCVEWMNNAGSLLGVRDGVLQILRRDGSFEPVVPGLQPAFSGFLTDDDRVFFQLGEASGALKAGAVFVGPDGPVNIGYGVAQTPPGAVLMGEITVLLHVSAGGHAIGHHTIDVEFDDECLGSTRLDVPFHWSAASGATRIAMEGRTIQLKDVNNDGVVIGRSVGEAARDRWVFVWTVESGVMRLDRLVSNLPSGVELVEAGTIGNGGHILAYAVQGDTALGWVLLTPGR